MPALAPDGIGAVGADGGVEADATLTYARASCTLLKMPPATVLFDLMVWARRLVSGEGVQVIRIHAVLARAALAVLLLAATSLGPAWR
jgi:hypothetical protein